jgi:hypothetical protein
MWGNVPLTPPPSLVTVVRGDLIGQTVSDANGVPALQIVSLLAQPSNGSPLYAVTRSQLFPDELVVPIAVLRVAPQGVSIAATRDQLLSLPRATPAQLAQAYPMSPAGSGGGASGSAPIAAAGHPVSLTTPPRSHPTPSTAAASQPQLASVAPPPAPPPGEAQATASGATAPLNLMRRGSIVGFPVTDAYGHSVGTVEAVATVPTTGEVRYAIVSGPDFGIGQYIAVPAQSARAADGKVILAGTLDNWVQAPRYRGDQVNSMLFVTAQP